MPKFRVIGGTWGEGWKMGQVIDMDYESARVRLEKGELEPAAERQKDNTIPLFWPSYNGREIQEEMKKMFPEDMDNRWLGQAYKVDELERKFGEKFGYSNCLALNSGSAALELAYHLIGLKKGDEVITPVLTCTATNIPLLRRGVKIVFADVKDDLTIDPMDVAKKITKKTKAIIGVTLGGVKLDDRLFAIASGIPVVVDAAQSLGTAEKRYDFVCYSFQAIKHFTTGDGGMLVCKNKDDHERAKRLRWFGIDREAKIAADWQPYQKRQMTMDIEEPGYKFHMNDICASLGLIGLSNSDIWLSHRREIGEYYKRNIKHRVVADGAYWLACIFVKNRDKAANFLKSHGVETNMAHLRNDIFKVFGGKRQKLPNMDKLESQYLYIPLNLKVNIWDAEKISKLVNELP